MVTLNTGLSFQPTFNVCGPLRETGVTGLFWICYVNGDSIGFYDGDLNREVIRQLKSEGDEVDYLYFTNFTSGGEHAECHIVLDDGEGYDYDF